MLLNKIQNDNESGSDDLQSDRYPASTISENISRIRSLVRSDRRLTVREIEDVLRLKI